MGKNLFIIVLLIFSFGVAIFEREIFPFFKMDSYGKETFGFEKDFGPRWVPFFPFSSMPMYDEHYDPAFVTQLEIVGVTYDGREVPLSIGYYFYPLWPEAMREMYINHRLAGMSKKEFFGHILDFYEKRRKSGFYDWAPKLQKMKVFALTWNFQEWVSMRKSAPSLHTFYDWYESDFSPEKQNLITTVSADE